MYLFFILYLNELQSNLFIFQIISIRKCVVAVVQMTNVLCEAIMLQLPEEDKRKIVEHKTKVDKLIKIKFLNEMNVTNRTCYI